MIPMNPLKLLQIKNSWDQFKLRHPKLPLFISAVSGESLTEGTVIEVTVTAPCGRSFQTNLKLTAEDMQLVNDLKDMASSQ